MEELKEAMSGMLSIHIRYTIEGSHWQFFAQEVVSAFNHPMFNGLRRFNQPTQVSHLFCRKFAVLLTERAKCFSTGVSSSIGPVLERKCMDAAILDSPSWILMMYQLKIISFKNLKNQFFDYRILEHHDSG